MELLRDLQVLWTVSLCRGCFESLRSSQCIEHLCELDLSGEQPLEVRQLALLSGIIHRQVAGNCLALPCPGGTDIERFDIRFVASQYKPAATRDHGVHFELQLLEILHNRVSVL